MITTALRYLASNLGDLLLGPVVRAAELTADHCSAAILADLRWSALATSAPRPGPSIIATPMGCSDLPSAHC